MACTEHNWYFDTPCCVCAKSTAAVSGINPETFERIEAIPRFLQRNKDNTLKYPLNDLAAPESAERRKLEYAADEGEPCTAS